MEIAAETPIGDIVAELPSAIPVLERLYELRLHREITGDDQPPTDTCTTYRALADLDQDLLQHLRNDILFPRTSAAAKERQ